MKTIVLVKRASVMALATVVGCGIFGCQKKTEPIIPEVSVRVEETLDNDGDTIREVESVIGKERKSYIEESSEAKEEESTEAIPTPIVLSKEEFQKMIDDNKKEKTGTDAKGRPYLQKGQDFTFKDNGMGEPVEAPRSKRTAVNPNTGVKYIYLSTGDWIVDTSKEDEEKARLIREEGYTYDSNGNLVKGRKPTEEEARRWAKMFSDSFK